MEQLEQIEIGVIGGGSWGTALVKILQDNPSKTNINWWVKNPDNVAHIKTHHHNPNYLRSVEIHPDDVYVSANIKEIIAKSEIVIVVVPAAFVPAAIDGLDSSIWDGKTLVSAVKGLIGPDHDLPANYFFKQFGIPMEQFVAITGPCHAEEVSEEKLSYLTLAAGNQIVGQKVAFLLQNRYIKTTVNTDLQGIEFASVLKNVYAITAGICHGLGYGDNFHAVLVSNGIREMKRFISTVYPTKRDSNSSAYLGDLLVTSYSLFSRNRRFGNMLGKGYSVRAAQEEMSMIAEGYYSTKSVYELNKKYQISMPILDYTYKVLYTNIEAQACIDELLNAIH
jgi:glycerol-3-phosphate dehydrogenase (NAD(P)+)